jgi:soluble cytochrome b562
LFKLLIDVKSEVERNFNKVNKRNANVLRGINLTILKCKKKQEKLESTIKKTQFIIKAIDNTTTYSTDIRNYHLKELTKLNEEFQLLTRTISEVENKKIIVKQILSFIRKNKRVPMKQELKYEDNELISDYYSNYEELLKEIDLLSRYNDENKLRAELTTKTKLLIDMFISENKRLPNSKEFREFKIEIHQEHKNLVDLIHTLFGYKYKYYVFDYLNYNHNRRNKSTCK